MTLPLAVEGLSTGAVFERTTTWRYQQTVLDADVAMAPWTVERIIGGWLVRCVGHDDCRAKAGGRLLGEALTAMWRQAHQRTCARAVVLNLTNPAFSTYPWETRRRSARRTLVPVDDLAELERREDALALQGATP